MFGNKSTNTKSRFDRAEEIFQSRGGILRTGQAIRAGIHPDTLYRMRDSGTIEMISRGVYRLADYPPMSNPDLATVAIRIPNGVICLLSALSFHNLTTRIPGEVDVALPPGSEEPRLEHPPVRVYRFKGEAFTEGAETHEIDGVKTRIFCPEKTIADCFKFRNRIGLETVLEAVRLYRERDRINIDELMRYAEICRVSKIIRPYLEALFS